MRIELEETVCGGALRVEARKLDRGIHVLLTGGASHVGAVSAAEPGREPETMAFPGHKDHIVSEQWAAALADAAGERAVVACGIHFDDATAEQIAAILRKTDELLSRLIEKLQT